MSLNRPCSQNDVAAAVVGSNLIDSTASTCPQLLSKDEGNKRRKKKCRGDRKRQRFRAKLRRQGFDNVAIESAIHNWNDLDQAEANLSESTVPLVNIETLLPLREQEMDEHENISQVNCSKRKRHGKSTGIAASISQMSITCLPSKRQRSITMESIITEQEQIRNLSSDMKPKYLQVPDQIFQEMLRKSSTDAIQMLVPTLDTPGKVQFVRTYAHLLNNIFYLEMDLSFWKYYEEVLTKENIWSSSALDQRITEKNNLYRSKFKTENQLTIRHTLVGNRLRQAQDDLNQHKKQAIHHSFDKEQLSRIVTAFVRRGQHKLTADYERKKRLLHFDASDYRLVREFYDLKPTSNQIQSVRLIWQSTKEKLQAEEELNILKQRLYTKRLPASFQILDHSIDNIPKLLRRPALDRNKRAALSSRRLKIIAQFKYDLMTLAIITLEETIRSYTNIITLEKKHFIASVTRDHDSHSSSSSLTQTMNVLTRRETNMIQRQQLILKQQLSVFDDAPTTENMTTTPVLVVGAQK